MRLNRIQRPLEGLFHIFHKLRELSRKFPNSKVVFMVKDPRAFLANGTVAENKLGIDKNVRQIRHDL